MKSRSPFHKEKLSDVKLFQNLTFLQSFCFFSKKMQILRKIKNLQPATRNQALYLIHCLQIQVLVIFILGLNIPFYKQILTPKQFLKETILEKVIVGNFVFNLCTFVYFGIYIILRFKCSQLSIVLNDGFLKFFKYMPYVACVQIINFNTLSTTKIQLSYMIMGLINIASLICQMIIIKISNISYRFLDRNYIQRKNNCIICWLLIVPIIASAHYLAPQFTCFFISLRSLIQLYFNFFNLQNYIIRKIEYFYPFLTLSLTTAYLSNEFFQFNIFSNIIFASFVFLLAAYSSQCFADSMMMLSLRYHLSRNKHLFLLQNEAASMESFGTSKDIDKSEIQNFLLLFRILINVYITRLVFNKKEEHNQQNVSEPTRNYDFWWKVFNLTILKHKVQCIQPLCLCKQFEPRSTQNPRIQEKLFMKTVISLLDSMIESMTIKSNKLQIVEKYFLIEFFNKPIKAYYQLIKFYQQKLILEEQLEVEGLIEETREIFQKIFLIQKVKNQKLEIQPILQFEHKIKQMRLEMSFLASHYRNFYQNFSKKMVEVDQLKKQTLIISKLKTDFNFQIQKYITKFDRNIQFLTFCIVYYQYFDQYSGKLDMVKNKNENLQEKLNQSNLNLKRQIDVFNPIYGAVKIDLVFHLGKIVSLTKNICNLLGFKQDDLVGQKVNRLMPMIFSKNHDKFLKNFVNDGTFYVLKRKQRTFYAKTSKKFIVPITVRLKVQYLNSNSFCSTALINKARTKSQFILINNYGKIQEISENIFRFLFSPAVQNQIGKIKRLSLFKLLLQLNFLIDKVSENQSQVHEGMIMTSKNEKSLLSVFKSHRISQHIDETEQSFEHSSKSGTFSSDIHSIKQSIQDPEDKGKLKNDLKESFKQFLKLIKLEEINVYKISYKFYEVVTSEFRCKMLEILSINDQLSQNIIRDEVSQQITQISQFYELKEQDTHVFRTSHSLQNTNQKTSTRLQMDIFNMKSKNNLKSKHNIKTIVLNSQEPSEGSNQNFVTFKDHGGLIHLDEEIDTNEGSRASTSEKNQESHAKQNIMTAFEKKSFMDFKVEALILILVLMLALTFLVVSIFSLKLQSDYKNLQQDNLFLSNIRINFEFRLAIQQLQHFYNLLNLQTPGFLQVKKLKIIKDLKTMLKNSFQWVDNKVWQQIYNPRLNLISLDNKFQEDRQILFTLNKIYSIFSISQEQGQYLSHNYIQINSNLNQMARKEKNIILERSSNFQIRIHVTLALYVVFLILLIIVFVWANRIVVEKENKVVDFLPFLNPKLIIKQMYFYDKIHQYIKQQKPLDVTNIQRMHSAQKTIIIRSSKGNSKRKQNAQSSMNPIKIPKSKQKNPTEGKLLHIIKSQDDIFTPKNILLFGFILCLCISLVLYSQIFFSVAHSKFKAYVIIKDAALIIENIPPRLMVMHFNNFHLMLKGKQPFVFPEQFYNNAHEQAYALRANLSIPQFFDTDIMNLANKHVTKQICKLMTCQETTPANEHQILGYMTYHFKNVFDYIRLIQQMLPKQNVQAELRRWIDENHLHTLLEAIQNVLQVMKVSQKEITELFDQQISTIGSSLSAVSISLIPVLVGLMLLVRKRLIGLVSKRIEDTQNIYKQLSWNILFSNSYAINYFQQKIKNIKHS